MEIDYGPSQRNQKISRLPEQRRCQMAVGGSARRVVDVVNRSQLGRGRGRGRALALACAGSGGNEDDVDDAGLR